MPDLSEVIWIVILLLCGSDIVLVLITYDVNTETKEGRKRLRRVAKLCVDYGVRVQNSVFECILDAAQCRKLKHMLEKEIDISKDSLRFYYLGDKYKTKIEHLGTKAALNVEQPLIF